MADISNCRVVLLENHPLYGKKGKTFTGDSASLFPKEHCHLFAQVNNPLLLCNKNIPFVRNSYLDTFAIPPTPLSAFELEETIHLEEELLDYDDGDDEELYDEDGEPYDDSTAF